MIRERFTNRLLVPILLVVTSMVEPAASQRRIPDDNLAYPVLVTHSSGTGSGFFLNTDTSTYFITARHVVHDSAGALRPAVTLSAYGADPKDKGKYVMDADLTTLQAGGHVRDDNKQDVVAVRITRVTDLSTRAMSVVPGVTVKSAATSRLVGVGMSTVKRFDDVLISNPTMIFGYPRSIGIPNVPQYDPERPLLRGGIVAGKNETTRRAIIIDCPSYPGNSGGPVVELEEVNAFTRRFMVIGVIVEFVPSMTTAGIANSGYTVVAPMDGVLDLVDALEKQK